MQLNPLQRKQYIQQQMSMYVAVMNQNLKQIPSSLVAQQMMMKTDTMQNNGEGGGMGMNVTGMNMYQYGMDLMNTGNQIMNQSQRNMNMNGPGVNSDNLMHQLVINNSKRSFFDGGGMNANNQSQRSINYMQQQQKPIIIRKNRNMANQNNSFRGISGINNSQYMHQQQQQQHGSNVNLNFQLPAQPQLPANIELQPVNGGDNKMRYVTKQFQ